MLPHPLLPRFAGDFFDLNPICLARHCFVLSFDQSHFLFEHMRSASMQSPSADAASNIVFLGIAWVMSYTAMPAEPTAILAALIVIDFFAGIGKSLACGIAITSHRMRIGILSKLGLLLIPLAIALAAKGLSKDLVWIVGYTINLMILSELYSILANIYTVRTGRDAPEWDVVSVLLGKIRQIMDRIDGGRH